MKTQVVGCGPRLEKRAKEILRRGIEGPSTLILVQADSKNEKVILQVGKHAVRIKISTAFKLADMLSMAATAAKPKTYSSTLEGDL